MQQRQCRQARAKVRKAVVLSDSEPSDTDDTPRAQAAVLPQHTSAAGGKRAKASATEVPDSDGEDDELVDAGACTCVWRHSGGAGRADRSRERIVGSSQYDFHNVPASMKLTPLEQQLTVLFTAMKGDGLAGTSTSSDGTRTRCCWSSVDTRRAA